MSKYVQKYFEIHHESPEMHSILPASEDDGSMRMIDEDEIDTRRH